MDRDGADLAAVIICGQNHITSRAGSQHTVFVCAVGDGVDDILWDICRGAGRRYACDGNFGGGAGSYILIGGSHRNMVKHIGRCRSRSDDEAGRDGTLGAVGGTVDNADGVGTLRACGIGGGAAAVEVYRRYAACLEHDLRKLVHCAAAGEGLLTTVENHHDDLAVGGNAHAGAGVAVGVIRAGCTCRDILAVTDEPLRACRRLPDGAFAIFIDIVAEILCIVDNGGFAVLENGEEVVIAARAEGYAVYVGDAHRLAGGHVIEGRIHSGDYVVVLTDVLRIFRVRILLIRICNLIRELLHTHYAVFVLIEVGGLHDYIVTGDVGSGNIVDHLLAILGVGVVDVLLHTGSEGRFGVLEHIVGFRDELGACAAGLFCECGDGHQAEHHHCAQKQRQQSLGSRFFHFASPLYVYFAC